jgi:hypothetical protein
MRRMHAPHLILIGLRDSEEPDFPHYGYSHQNGRKPSSA